MYALSRAETCAKLFFVITFIGLFVYIFLAFYTFHSAYMSISQTKKYQIKLQAVADPNFAVLKSAPSIKNILLWTIEENATNPIGEGQEPFLKYDCLHQNCYITKNKNHLKDYTKFDAVIFNSTDLKVWNKTMLPERRSWDQKYVFYSKIAADVVTICNHEADTFFNWTWTYKLYSDILSPFIIVKNLQGTVVAPRHDVFWDTKMYEPLDVLKTNKTTKRKAMAWIRDKSQCRTRIGIAMRDLALVFQEKMRKENLEFDIFGCNDKPCGDDCLKMIERDYFFYWIHEGILSEDYVTAEVMTAFKTNTIPLITGVADISKFLPPGSYVSFASVHLLDDIEDINGMIIYITKNPVVYRGFFRWKKHFTIEATAEFYGLCQLCSNLNNNDLMNRHTHYELFRKWWFIGSLQERCYKFSDTAKQNEGVSIITYKA